MVKDLAALVLSAEVSVRDVLTVLNREAAGVVFLADQTQRLIGLATDGDVRRAFLGGATLTSAMFPYLRPTFAAGRHGRPHQENLTLLTEDIRYLPILDEDGRLVDFLSWADFWRTPLIEPTLGGNELKYVADCITSNWVSSQGPYVKRFETAFAALHQVEHAISTSNGTSALHVSLVAMGVGRGDEVIVPDLTFAATANAVLHCGATPVLVDVDERDWNIDVDQIEAAITPRTRAIIPVHLYGRPCDMRRIMRIARDHRLGVIEDCAEALGATFEGQRVGTFGDAACFSFFSNKVITTGEGGMVLARTTELAERVRCLRDHGMRSDKRYWHDVAGFNYRMTNLQAAVGVAQLEQIERFLQNRRAVADRYTALLSDVPGIGLPSPLPRVAAICWLYSILVDEAAAGLSRDDLARLLERQGIETRPVFYPLHEQPPYPCGGAFPVAGRLSRAGLSLPTGNGLPFSEVEKVSFAITEIIENRQVFARVTS